MLSGFLNTMQFRLERFEHQDYTLRTYDAVQQGNVLDIFLHIDCDRLDRDCGGTIVFVDGDEDERGTGWDSVSRKSVFTF